MLAKGGGLERRFVRTGLVDDQFTEIMGGDLEEGDRSSSVRARRSHERDYRAAKPEPLIAATGVSKTYRMGDQTVNALDNVSLEIDAGEFVAIMGPSGSGKSTMMNLIGALDVPTEGHLLIDGRDIGKLSADELADLRNRTIGFVFQQFNLLPRTSALRQVMLPLLYAHPRPANAEEMARPGSRRSGSCERLDHHPRQLSGGQQQRVAIARALINNPKILLADEPTGALDSKTSDEIMQLFAALNGEGITVVLVTHEPDIALWAERRITFRDGHIIDDVRQTPHARGGRGMNLWDSLGVAVTALAHQPAALDPDDARHRHRRCVRDHSGCGRHRRLERGRPADRGARHQHARRRLRREPHGRPIGRAPAPTCRWPRAISRPSATRSPASSPSPASSTAPARSCAATPTGRRTFSGVHADYTTVRDWPVVSGRELTPNDIRTAAQVALIGQDGGRGALSRRGPGRPRSASRTCRSRSWACWRPKGSPASAATRTTSC